jgi:outer membrane receptor protein involved in Fe transport
MGKLVDCTNAPARRHARGLLLATTGLAMFAAGIGAAHAQQAPVEQAAAPTSGLEEVIVTARKKSENIQNVPVAVTALSAKTLDRYALTSVEKIAATTPELVVVRGNSGSGADISLRGVGSSFTSVGIEQSVAVDVDGVYYGQGRVLNEALFDMKQVEILKGPQALFFGKNASAGVVSFTTADPTSTFESMLRASYEFTANEPMVEGYVSGPVTDKLTLRLAIHYQDMLGGYVQNLAPAAQYTTLDVSNGFAATVHNIAAPDKNVPQEKDLVGRFSAKYEFTNNLTDTFKTTLDQYRVLDATWNSITFFCPTGTRQTAPGEPCGKNYDVYQNNLPADIAATNPITARHGGQLYQDYDSQSYSNTLKYDAPLFNLESVTGFHHFINYFEGDYDLTGAVNSPAGTWGIEKSQYQAFSTELRAQTKFKSPVNFMGGFLYQATQLNFNQFVIFPGGLSDLSLHTPDEYITVEKLSRTNGQTFSGFAQGIWDITSQWNLTVGARYTHETKDSYFIQPYVVAPFQGVFRQYNPADPASFIGKNQTFDNTSPEATLSWKPERDLTLYASYKTGYKSGGFSGSALNSALANTTAAQLAFKPETPKGFEGGVKSTLLDGRLRLNADAYDYVYDNFQVDFFDSVHIDYVTKNVGKLESRGFEVQAEWAPERIEGLHLNGAMAFNESYYKSFPNGPCYGGQSLEEGCHLDVSTNPNDTSAGQLVQNLTGQAAGQAPKWTSTLEADYERTVGGLLFGVSGNAHLSSSYHLASSATLPTSSRPTPPSTQAFA